MATQNATPPSEDGPATVLFVDDEPALLDLYEQLFGERYTVLTAESGEQALDLFDGQIDIAFFDRRMPDLSGVETMERLRNDGYETPMVILSGIDPETDPEVEYADYLTKPVDSETVRTTIARHATSKTTE